MRIFPLGSFVLRTSLPLLVASLALAACGGKDKGGGGGGDGDGDGNGDGDGDSPMGGAPMAPPNEPVTTCDTSSDCNDYFYCNGEETCEDGFCRPGEPIECDDGIACTSDRCDEESQECESIPPDEDGDGHVDAACEDEDGTPLGDDCDDDDSLSYPGAQEVCDQENRDEDCDPSTFGTKDTDQDLYIDAHCCNEQSDGEFLCGEDCDDNKTNVNPAATEACDFLDNNCDGDVDEGVSVQMYEDKDHDGRGDDDAGAVQSCVGAVGYSLVDGDCDDSDPEVFIGQFEICDGKDNNCSGVADEVQEQAPWFKDVDGDGYGDADSNPVYSCYRVPGRVLSQNDCDDTANLINPNAAEVCDGKDNNCNGVADYLVGVNDFEDDDGDGVADAACGGEDCNDLDARTAAGAEEVCDRVDNDCDGEVDEQTVQNIWYIDNDGDGWGVVIGSALASCDPLPNRASQFGDCDDGDRNIKPGVAEVCDGIDNDCDGSVDEGASSQCVLDNALSICRSGQCDIYSCVPGFADTDNNPVTGCEAVAPPPTPLPGPGVCNFDSQCNNGNLCDGIETCIATQCFPGTPINCSSGPNVIQGNVAINNGLDLKDLEEINVISGDLTIDATFLSSLVGLEELTVIGGNLYIRGNTNLVRLSGSALSNLEVVGGGIFIENNPSLIDVDLPSLVSATSLNIVNNDSLARIGSTMLRAYANLVIMEQLIYIADNDALERISGFDALGRIGGGYDLMAGEVSPCQEQGGLEIEYNLALVDIDAFGALASIEGDLCIESDPSLDSFDFAGLEEILQVMRFGYLDVLEAIEMPALEVVGDQLEINNYAGGEGGSLLATVSMPNLREVGGALACDIAGYPSIVEELSFPSLEEANGLDLYANGADALTSVDLSSLKEATYVYVDYQPLYGLSGTTGLPAWSFPALADVPQYFDFYGYGDVTSLAAPLLENAGDIYVYIQSDLTTSLLFPALTQVGASVQLYCGGIQASPQLDEVDFGSLQTIGAEGNFSCDTLDLDISSLQESGPLNNYWLTTCVPSNADLCPFTDGLVNGWNQQAGVGYYETCGVCDAQTLVE